MEQKKFITYTAGHAPVRKQLLLFWIFFIIGTFTIGGGYAMILMMKRYVVEQYHWFYDMLGISQVTPGPIAVNMATFVGYKLRGLTGTLVTSLGVILPSFIIILIIATVTHTFRTNRWVSAFLDGLQPVVLALSPMRSTPSLGAGSPRGGDTSQHSAFFCLY